MITDTIVPWVLGTLLSLTLLMLLNSIKAWRELKHSPYFFLRQRAEKRLQSYSFISLVLLLSSLAFAAFAWQSPLNNTPHVAILLNSKPPKEDVIALLNRPAVEDLVTVAVDNVETQFTANSLRDGGEDPIITDGEPVLPEKYDQFEPTAELRPDTALGEISFSTEVDADYQPIAPGQIFPEGAYKLYATFSYEDMADGLEWAWVWRHNGRVVDGGNELWVYGADGPGYVFFNPEEGFLAGEYSLEIWVNGRLFTASKAIMNSSAALSVGN